MKTTSIRKKSLARHALCAGIAFTFLLAAGQARAEVGESFTEGIFRYTILSEDVPNGSGTVSVVSVPEAEVIGEIVIPPTVSSGEATYTVTQIGLDAFSWRTMMTSLSIPDTVTEIETWALNYCTGLESIVIPDSVTRIGDSSFYYTSTATNLVIGANVAHIGNSAFSGCMNLPSVKIPDSVLTIGPFAFNFCSSMESLEIGSGLTHITQGAFSYATSLRSLVIPDTVISIGDRAFLDAESLHYLLVGENVASIDSNAFAGNMLSTAYFKGEAPEIGETVFKEYTLLFYMEGKAGWTTPTWNGYNTAVWIPLLEPTLTYRIRDGKLILTYTGNRLEESTNLRHWFEVDTSGEYETEIYKKGFRFYRAAM